MSLKAFHVFFVTASVLLSIGFGVWCLNAANQIAAGVAFVVAGALVVYEIAFIKKFKDKP